MIFGIITTSPMRWSAIGLKRMISKGEAEMKRQKVVRPDWDEFTRGTSGGYLQCACGLILQTFELVREHWQRGHFDYVANESSRSKDEEKT
jgi:hypothetical protein